MSSKLRLHLGISGLAAIFLFISDAGAQQKQAPAPQASLSYDVNREALVQGTVVSYTADSAVPPIGPHASIQTSSGIVDVHLGSTTVMKQNDIFLQPGDSVKIVGVTEPFGSSTIFLARVLQKGNQTVTLRNLNGIPIVAKPAANARPRSAVGGAR